MPHKRSLSLRRADGGMVDPSSRAELATGQARKIALVAELEYARRSGRRSRKGLEVRILSRAQVGGFPVLSPMIIGATKRNPAPSFALVLGRVLFCPLI